MKNIVFFLLLCNIVFIESRNHVISIKDDRRPSILLSHFGYYSNACLHLTIDKFEVSNISGSKMGFSLDRSSSDSAAAYLESYPNKCIFDEDKISALLLKYNQFNNSLTVVTTKSELSRLLIYKDIDFSPNNNSTQLGPFNMTAEVQNRLFDNLSILYGKFIDAYNASDIANETLQPFRQPLQITPTERKAVLDVFKMKNFDNVVNNPNVISNLKMIIITAKKALSNEFVKKMDIMWKKLEAPIQFHVNFPLKLSIAFPTSEEEGDYDLVFHNCAPRKGSHMPVNISMTLVEKNWNSYLSAGNQPLPLLFFIMCSAYIVLTIIWSLTLFTSEHMVFKIHYLMMTLLVVKSLSLFFHGINYYELGRNGVPEQGWAVMYYITHLLKGAVLFTTIILIGAGWEFIKHMLTGKERNIFIIIIPLQILANVAAIIIDESEESAVRYLTWRNIFLLVDLICCGAILFPVIWSIKHLKEVANIDGKQAQNLQKLKLFRHFYILVICYIYSTRIIVYLLVITASFKLTWTVDLFRELSTLFFIVVTGYKFRPASNNPYLLVPLDQVTEEEQMEHAWSQSGVTEGVVKINQVSKLDSDNDGEETDDNNTMFENSAALVKTQQQYVNDNGRSAL